MKAIGKIYFSEEFDCQQIPIISMHRHTLHMKWEQQILLFSNDDKKHEKVKVVPSAKSAEKMKRNKLQNEGKVCNQENCTILVTLCTFVKDF
jgi:hypothetical protein